jgi:IS1 family transposase/transposase-like protein
MLFNVIVCPSCQSTNIGRHGLSAEGKTRYKCRNTECKRCTFILNYTYQGYLPEVKEKITDMAMNGSGIRDTARVLNISPSTVINELKKKESNLVFINKKKLAELEPSQCIVRLCQWEDVEAELDEMWSFVNSKKEQRWLWHAINHDTGEILAYVLSGHKDEAFLRLKELLEPFGITQYYTDGWGAYERHIEPALHSVGKCNTQKIERKHLTLRTRIKRLARKTICFSKSIVMHDIVLGLFINRFEFGCLI